jgi:hypothetical protein
MREELVYLKWSDKSAKLEKESITIKYTVKVTELVEKAKLIESTCPAQLDQ